MFLLLSCSISHQLSFLASGILGFTPDDAVESGQDRFFAYGGKGHLGI